MASAARIAFFGQPGPRTDTYPKPDEWKPARAGRRPPSPTFEPPKKRQRKARESAASKTMPTREEKRWTAVVKACTIRATCLAMKKRCPIAEMKKIASSIRVNVRTLNKLINKALTTGSLARIHGSGRRNTVSFSQLKKWFHKTSKKIGNIWTIRKMAAEMRKKWHGFGSTATVLHIAKRLGYARVKLRTLPLLRENNKHKRKIWTETLLKKSMAHLGATRQFSFMWMRNGFMGCSRANTSGSLLVNQHLL